MNILNIKQIVSFTKFEAMKNGSLFSLNGESFIKTRDMPYIECKCCGFGHDNAVSIKTGHFHNISDHEIVGAI